MNILTSYQRGIIAQWAEAARDEGIDREASISLTTAHVSALQEHEVRRIYDRVWPLARCAHD